MTQLYVGTFLVTGDDETIVLDLEIDLYRKLGLYTLKDRTGSVHTRELDLQDSDAQTFSELGFYALVIYLSAIRANDWTGTAWTIQAALGLEVGELDTVIQQFKSVYMLPTEHLELRTLQ